MTVRSERGRVLRVDAWDSRAFGTGEEDEARTLTESDRKLVRRLGPRRLIVRELCRGIEIQATSYVGIVPFDAFTVQIQPWITHEDFLRIIDYAYGVRRAELLPTGIASIEAGHVTDLLIAVTAGAVRNLITRGLHQSYLEHEETMPTARGKVMFAGLATNPAPAVALPCRFEKRSTDIQLNRVVTAIMGLARKLVTSTELLLRVSRYHEYLRSLSTPVTLSEGVFSQALGNLNRLTTHYETVLRLGWLIFLAASPSSAETPGLQFPGFLLDMNRVWEDFLERLLREFFPPGYRVMAQSKLESPYHVVKGHTPRHRPDLVVLDPNGRRVCIVDAKYKFYDRRHVASGDLYQLTVYGLADTTGAARAMALYPGEGSGNSEYLFMARGEGPLPIAFRAVRLGDVWDVLDGAQRGKWGEDLVMGLLG